MKKYSQNIIYGDLLIKDALQRLDTFTNKNTLTLFVVNRKEELIGTLTDGDIRRALLKGASINNKIEDFMHSHFRFLTDGKFSLQEIKKFKKDEIYLVPKVDENKKIIRIINFAEKKSVLPLDAIIMAGGKGERLKPLTDSTPKPLLPVGGKPILEHNIDQLINYGVERFHITVNYLADRIINHFQSGEEKEITIKYIRENQPLGTIGAVGLINDFTHEDILIMNADLLTDIDWERFYQTFLDTNADMQVATTSYKVNIPYAVLETTNENVKSFQEKPTYTYYSNAGIYLIKRKIIDYIPKNHFFNATDLIDLLIKSNYRVTHFPIVGYWLDIGKHDDYIKAQEDIKYLKL